MVPPESRLSVSQIYSWSQALSHDLSRDWLWASLLMTQAREAPGLLSLPFSFLCLFTYLHSETLFLWEALPDPRCHCLLCLVLPSGLTLITVPWDYWLVCLSPSWTERSLKAGLWLYFRRGGLGRYRRDPSTLLFSLPLSLVVFIFL